MWGDRGECKQSQVVLVFFFFDLANRRSQWPVGHLHTCSGVGKKKKLPADWSLISAINSTPNTFTIMCMFPLACGPIPHRKPLTEARESFQGDLLKKVALRAPDSRKKWALEPVGCATWLMLLGYFVYFNHNLICIFAFVFEISVPSPPEPLFGSQVA